MPSTKNTLNGVINISSKGIPSVRRLPADHMPPPPLPHIVINSLRYPIRLRSLENYTFQLIYRLPDNPVPRLFQKILGANETRWRQAL